MNTACSPIFSRSLRNLRIPLFAGASDPIPQPPGRCRSTVPASRQSPPIPGSVKGAPYSLRMQHTLQLNPQ